ncbi:MAG: response regulator [Eubacteriales bacterium]|nr:response regulator [Eubacteriales bacterium]
MDGVKKKVDLYMGQTGGTGAEEEQIAATTPGRIRQLIQENERLKQELRIRDNDILSHDQVFDSIVSGTLHLIFVMSVTTYRAEFVTSNIDTALGIRRAEAMEDVRRIGAPFEKIEEYNGREITLIHRTNGARRQFLSYVIHLPYGRSDRVAVVLLCRSNVSKGELEEMMIRQTQDVNRAAGYFLASMSHDFHVPVNSIAGFVLLLMKNAEDPAKVKEYAHRIGLACQEILSTVDQILDMSRIETSRAELEEEEFGLGLMLEEVSAVITSLSKARDLQYVFSATGIEHDIVLGDRGRLMEILRLVLSNGVKYTPPGGRVELTVSGNPNEEDGNVALLFEVRDTGIGMDQVQLQKFFRDEIPDRVDSPGRGTGIWLARRLISLMGGSISAHSRPGEGTIIWIRLQLKMVNSGVSDFWKRRGIRRMLIADKNLQEAARVRNLMKSAGVDAMSVSSGYGTIKMVEQAGNAEMAFDLILLDEELQDMDWREIISSVRKMTWIRIPSVFLMTKRQMRDEERRGMGISQVLQKPFYVSVFHRLVEQVCEEASGDGGDREGESGSVAGLHFLVAGDNAVNADMVRELLEMAGARCEIAGNGRAALAMFSNSKPGLYDAILMDLQMPVMDGYATASAIRALKREDAQLIPIFAMTISSVEEDEEHLKQSGIDAHIKKPLDLRVLQSLVRRFYEKRMER